MALCAVLALVKAIALLVTHTAE